MSFLEARSVVKMYANQLALDHVCMSVPVNSIYGLLGPNGAGKTTLIRIINQITGPDEGEIILEGNVLSPSDVERIGYLPEERGLYKKMKVGEQAVYLARLKGLSRNDALKKLKYWFEKFEIEAWWDKKVEELSKGMQQKVQFIVTILHNPTLLIFDEPFSGFDPINANMLKEEILNLKKEGATIIFSTHNMASVEELCDNITLINNGKSILEGAVNDIRQRYRQNIVRIDFAGDVEKIRSVLSANNQVLDISPLNGYHTALVKMAPGTGVNQLLSLAINNCEIHGCQEILPGMNDIFIEVVNRNK